MTSVPSAATASCWRFSQPSDWVHGSEVASDTGAPDATSKDSMTDGDMLPLPATRVFGALGEAARTGAL
jgi:hypothetical protein